MSDIISITDQLFEDFNETNERCLNPNYHLSKDVYDENDDLNQSSTLHLIDECLPFLLSEVVKTSPSKVQDKKENKLLKPLTNPPIKSDSFVNETKIESADDQLMVAAQIKVKRGKNKLLKSHESTEQSDLLCQNKVNQQPKSSADNSVGVVNMDVNEIDRIAYKCLEVFMNEVEEFYNKIDDAAELSKHAEHFASFVHEKYILLSLDLLPNANEAVSKVRKLVSNFVSKCKSTPAVTIERLAALNFKRQNKSTKGSKRKGWQCALCGRKDLSLCQQKCNTCGRSRGFRKKDYSKDIQPDLKIDEARFLSSGNDNVEILSDAQKQQRHYLYNRRDFEIDSRLELKSDVSEVIESIRAFTTS